MDAVATDCPGLAELITRLDRSVDAEDAGTITAAVKADLEHILGTRALALPARMPGVCCIATPPAATPPSS